MKTKNWLLRLAFDGQAFHGTQRQAQGLTIQGLLEERLTVLCGTPINLSCSSRLDAKVSALDYCVSFRAPAPLTKEKLLRYLEKTTPETIKFKKLTVKGLNFDARKTPHTKTYIYNIDNGMNDPFGGRFLFRPLYPFDIDLLKQALALFVGTHDFSSFVALDSPKDKNRTFVTTIIALKVSNKSHKKIVSIKIKGRAFYRYQIRFMIGMAMRVAMGKTPLAKLAQLLNQPDLKALKIRAPAQGLLLYKTEYLGKGENHA